MTRPRIPSDSRARIVAAASAEFAARGFAGAGIDRIARRARVNKAMIYYHFASKQALYLEILREMYVALGEHLRTVTAGPGTPSAKIDAFIEAIVQEFEAHPHVLPIMLREMAEGGPHLGRQTLELMRGILDQVRTIIAEGVETGAFAPVNPALAYISMIGPLVVYRASAPVRARMGRLKIAQTPGVDRPTFVHHLQSMTRRMLSP